MPGQFRTFRERFCEVYVCPPTAFERTALMELLDPLPRIVAKFLGCIHPKFLRTDRLILRRVSHLDSVPDVLLAVQDLEKEYATRSDLGPLRRLINLRLSRSRLLKLTAKLWRRES